MGDYLKNRLAEPGTRMGLALIFVTVAKIFFPQYSMLIDAAASVLGVGAATLPDHVIAGGAPFPK